MNCCIFISRLSLVLCIKLSWDVCRLCVARFSLPTYLSDLLNVIGCDYVQAEPKVEWIHSPSRFANQVTVEIHSVAMLEDDLGFYSMNFLCLICLNVLMECKCVKSHHLWGKIMKHLHMIQWKAPGICDVQIQYEKNVSFHSKPQKTIKNPICWLSYYTYHSQATTRGRLVRGCHWAIFLCRLTTLEIDSWKGLWWSGRTTTGAISGCATSRSMGS